jgi:CheY-like chemotaxis protein
MLNPSSQDGKLDMLNQTTKKKVLIVDDELGVRRLVRQILSQDYTVLEAQNGEEAVDMAHSQKPDLILMDMLLPKMDGLTACYAIKQNQATRGILVIMLTAIDYSLNRKLAETMSADGYIAKPFDSQDLLGPIGRLLNSKIPTSKEAGNQAQNNIEELKL